MPIPIQMEKGDTEPRSRDLPDIQPTPTIVPYLPINPEPAPRRQVASQ